MLVKTSIQFYSRKPQIQLDTGFRQYDTPFGRVWSMLCLSVCWERSQPITPPGFGGHPLGMDFGITISEIIVQINKIMTIGKMLRVSPCFTRYVTRKTLPRSLIGNGAWPGTWRAHDGPLWISLLLRGTPCPLIYFAFIGRCLYP